MADKGQKLFMQTEVDFKQPLKQIQTNNKNPAQIRSNSKIKHTLTEMTIYTHILQQEC